MDILGTLLGSVQGGAVGQVAAKLGLGSSDSRALVEKLVPALLAASRRTRPSPAGSRASPRRSAKAAISAISMIRRR